LHQPYYKQDLKKRKITKKFKLLLIFLSPQDSVRHRRQNRFPIVAGLHKMEAAEGGLLLDKSAEYTASHAHRPTPAPMTPPSIPPPATRAQLGFPPKIIFLEIKRVSNNIT
jgi:hypothetical protein